MERFARSPSSVLPVLDVTIGSPTSSVFIQSSLVKIWRFQIGYYQLF